MKKKLEKEVLLSHGRCSKEGLSKDISQPKESLSEKELGKALENNRDLIKAFTQSIAEIEDFLDEEYLFLLTDFKVTLLKKIDNLSNDICIKPGMSFLSESSGTNAISLAKKIEDRVFLTPDQHYCEFLQQWYCFALPLRDEEEIIGFLDVSSVKKNLKDELKGITVLLQDRILKKLNKLKTESKTVDLTSKQEEIL